MMFSGDFTQVLAKHSTNLSLQDCLCVGVDRMQRDFEPMKRQVEQWQEAQIPGVTAKLIIYRAFVDGELDAPSSLMVGVHRNYLQPLHPEFSTRTLWSLCNVFTSAFKDLDPIPQFKASAKLRAFLSKAQP